VSDDLQVPQKRVSWDATWITVALVIAERSLCSRDQVGAVVVSANNRIVSTGYNGPPAGFNHRERRCTWWCDRALKALNPDLVKVTFDDNSNTVEPVLASDYSDCPSLHAEANALSVCDRSVREGGTIYVTSHVCFACAKLVANSGLRRVVVRAELEHAHRNSEESYALLFSCGLDVLVVNADGAYNRAWTHV
jgi:dCMP deaminase